MANKWPKVTIESIQARSKGAIAIGPFGSRLKSDNYVESGVPVIRGTNISSSPNFEGDFVFITSEKADTLGSSNVYQNDLVFPHRGAIGEVGIVEANERYVLSSSLMKLTVDSEQMNPMYLYYFFKSRVGRHELLKNASTVGTPGIGQPLTSLKSIEFLKPPLGEQNQIVEILKTLDNKITLNRQINQTLEQMAQTLFKSWFVDFDPVMDNALDAGNPIPDELQHRAEARKAVRESEGFKPLPDEVRQLFPDAFEESELGWVPKGWEIKSSGDMIDVRDGTHASPKKSDHGFPLVTSKNLTSGRLDLSNAYLISSEDYEDVNKRSKVSSGDILLTMIGTLGVPCLISVSEVNFAIKNVGLFRTSQTPLFKNYFFELLKSREMQRYLDSRAAGTTQKYLSLKVLRNIPFLCPSDAVLSVFNQYAQMYESKVQQNTEQSEQLTKLRDTLLPKLISGELCLDDVEAAVEKETVSA
ncbi:TPA: restriction endonuclease subunit S [Vibrio vulnificus]